jgi:SPP1 family predicted phage head-tail adaptor
MSAPELNRRLVLEAPQLLADGAGGYVNGWVPVGTVWAQVTPRSGRETAQSGAPVSRMAYRIIVHGAQKGSDRRPAAQQRFREGERIFTIEAVAEHDAQGRYLACFASEEQVV